MNADGPFREVSDGLTVTLRVVPRAGRSRIEGVVADADGTPVLKVSVTAAPEDGRANEAVIALLAKTWRVPKTSLSIRHGAAARRKLLHVAGDPRALHARLSAALAQERR